MNIFSHRVLLIDRSIDLFIGSYYKLEKKALDSFHNFAELVEKLLSFWRDI